MELKQILAALGGPIDISEQVNSSENDAGALVCMRLKERLQSAEVIDPKFFNKASLSRWQSELIECFHMVFNDQANGRMLANLVASISFRLNKNDDAVEMWVSVKAEDIGHYANDENDAGPYIVTNFVFDQ